MRVIYIFLFFLSACGATKYNEKLTCKQNLKNDIISGWKLTPDSSYYILSPDFRTRLDSVYKYCLHSMNSKKIIDLFGKPTNAFKLDSVSDLEYLISPPCNPKNKDKKTQRCNYLVFHFDTSDSMIKDYEIRRTELTMHQ